METVEKTELEKKLVVKGKNLPLAITYKVKEYILMLTKNDKLILNKAFK